MTTRDQVVANALSYVGTRWKHQGRAPGKGLDCAGVVICAFRDAHLYMTDNHGYSRLPKPDEMLAYLKTNGNEIKWQDRKPGDFLWLEYDEQPQHLAILVENDRIAHGFLRARQVIEQRVDADILARLVGIYRYKGFVQ